MKAIRYPENFKKEVAQEVILGGEPISQTARRHGVSVCSVRAWVKDFKNSNLNAQPNEMNYTLGPDKESLNNDDIEQLRSRLNKVIHERDILRTALVILARDIGMNDIR